VTALILGLAVSAALTLTALALYTHNERNLLHLRLREAESVLSSNLPTIQTPLASAAALADATRGNRKKFGAFIRPFAGDDPFISVSLWRLDRIRHGPKAVVGLSPELRPAAALAYFRRADASNQVSVMAMLHSPAPRIGYALTTPGPSQYVAYGETPVPRNRYAAVIPSSAFTDINFAIFLGRTPNPANLVLTSVRRLPVTGRQASATIPFGSTYLTLEVSPRGSLGGSLPQRLPWIIAAAGVVLTVFFVLLMLRLAEGRKSAEQLARALERIAAENERLYGEQRDIAQTLQHSLLPEELPQIPGVEVSARYLAGEQGVEIGGDWYDVIQLDSDHVLMIVGDVSGRGLRAATTMAALRHAIHAYAAENRSPGVILSKLSRLLSVTDTGKMATVLCAVLQISTHQVTLASAGHLPPLLIQDGLGRFLGGTVGPPIGMEHGAEYCSSTYPFPMGATLLAFTDGLVERRGEILDQGLARLRDAATSNHAALPELLTGLLGRMRGEPTEDDTAIVGIRWTG